MTDTLRESAQQAERAAFEAWWNDPASADNSKVYEVTPTAEIRRLCQDIAERAWQARAALAQQDEHCDNCKGSGAVVDMIYPTSDPQDACRAEVPCDECDGTGMVAGSQAHFKCPKCSDTEQQDAQAVPHLLPEHETEAMHNAVMAVMYQGVTRTNTDALWQAYRRALLNATPTPPAQQDAQAVRSKFLANGTRFKMSFFQNEDGEGNTVPGTHVTRFEAFEDELDGQWVALVPAEDDCHLNAAPTPPAQTNILKP